MIGHNSVSGEELLSIVKRVEALEAEKKILADDIRDIFAEAKGQGYDVKALREIVQLRRQDAQERSEHEATVEAYKHALGMLVGSPLGDWAVERAEAGAQ